MLRRTTLGAALVASVALVAAGCGGGSSSGNAQTGAPGGSTKTLVVENNPVATMTQTFNPFSATSNAKTVNALALIYEPLLQFNNTHAGQYYPWLATGYSWADGGKSLTFTLRNGVKWSDGLPFTSADVAYTFSLMQKNKALNYVGLPLTGEKTDGANKVTLTFSSAQYTNLYNIAGQTWMVPQHIFSQQSDLSTWKDPNPVGTGPYTLDKFSAQGFTLAANPTYWGGKPKVTKVSFPAYSSNTSALSALQNGEIDYTGNDINNIQTNFVDKDPAHNHYYFPATNTVVLIPNVSKWPFNNQAVRLAVSAGVNRDQLSKQGETGYEAPATSSSGLLLPNFSKNVPASMVNDLSGTPDTAKVNSLMTAAGFKKDSSGIWAKGGQEVAFTVEDPVSYSDYYADAQIIQANLKPLGFKVTVDGVTPDKWNSDVAAGNFSSVVHWGAGGPSAYAQYDSWLDSNLTATGAGDNGHWNDAATQTALQELAGASGTSAVQSAIDKIATIVSTKAPVIPLLYGAGWFEYSTKNFTGWPTKSNSYIDPSPNPANVEYTILHLTPTG